MFFRTIAAAFFIARANGQPPLMHLADDLGVHASHALGELERQALGLLEPDREVIYGQWADYGPCWVIVDRLEAHECLQVYASADPFLAGLPDRGQPAAENTHAALTAAFRDACLALDADVAFLDTRAYYGDEEWKNGEGTRRLVLGYYPMILEGNVNALADERFALLFVGDRFKARWESDEVRNDRWKRRAASWCLREAVRTVWPEVRRATSPEARRDDGDPVAALRAR